jgi:hypothetical protein
MNSASGRHTRYGAFYTHGQDSTAAVLCNTEENCHACAVMNRMTSVVLLGSVVA